MRIKHPNGQVVKVVRHTPFFKAKDLPAFFVKVSNILELLETVGRMKEEHKNNGLLLRRTRWH